MQCDFLRADGANGRSYVHLSLDASISYAVLFLVVWQYIVRIYDTETDVAW